MSDVNQLAVYIRLRRSFLMMVPEWAYIAYVRDAIVFSDGPVSSGHTAQLV